MKNKNIFGSLPLVLSVCYDVSGYVSSLDDKKKEKNKWDWDGIGGGAPSWAY